jgi:hypothetical protein
MRIRLSHPSFLNDLTEALLAGNCLSLRVGVDTLEVLHPDTSDAREAEQTLVFFLKAWQMAYPHVAAEIIS